MRPSPTSRRRSSIFRTIGIVFVLLFVVTGGIVASLWGLGFFGTEISREGMLAYPALARPVPAYSAISREDLLHPETGELHVVWLQETSISESMIRDLRLVVGRVAKKDISPGIVLTEGVLFPQGTRPGLAAGIPPGKRALSVDVEKIEGLGLLRQGDDFDLFVSFPKTKDDDASKNQVEYASLIGGIKPPKSRTGSIAQRRGVHRIAQGARMVLLTRGTETSTAGQQGLVVDAQSRRKQSVVRATIAIDPEESSILTEVLSLDDAVAYCVAHSGHPDDQVEETEAISIEGLVPVIAASQPIDALSAISPEHLADSATGQPNVYYFPPEKVAAHWVTDVSQLAGRVVRNNVAKGMILTENDLYPLGTRPGPTAATPTGMVAVRLPSSAIEGLDELAPGATFALHAQLPHELRPSYPLVEWAAVHGGEIPSELEETQTALRSGIRRVCREAMLIAKSTENDEVFIAVPQDVATAVSQLIFEETPMTAIAFGETNHLEVKKQNSPTDRRTINNVDDTDLIRFVAFQQEPSRGTVRVPVTARPVRSFEKLSIDDFIDPATGQIRYYDFPSEKVDPGWLDSLANLIDRVPRVPLDSGRPVSSQDLLPTGTRPGVSAGVPPGWVAISVTSLDVRGLGMIEELDRIDLVASRPIVAEALQAKAQWPLRRSDATFALPNSQDIFTQADVRVIAAEAIVLTKAVEKIEVQVTETVESLGDESELGDVINRSSVTRRHEPRFVERQAIVCSLAVPAESVPAVTEALAIQDIVQDGDNQQSGEAGSATSDVDNEIALFAVVRSSNPDSLKSQTTIPHRDVVQDWLEQWTESFSGFLRHEQAAVESVQRRTHLRGDARTEEYWLNGKSYEQFPVEAVDDAAIKEEIQFRGIPHSADGSQE